MMDIFFPGIIFIIPFFGLMLVLLSPKMRASATHSVLRGGIIISIAGLFIGLWAMKTLYDEKNISFNGVIEKVYYEVPKKIPYITIKGVEYCWGGNNYPDNDTIRVGDSAVKIKGSFEFKLIRQNSHKTQ